MLDLDGKFDGVRLMQMLEPQVLSAWRAQQAQRAAASDSDADVGNQLLSPDQVVEEVLSRLHLLRCRSSVHLLAALAALPARLTALQDAGVPCRLLLMDNVGAHYWRDRAAKNVGAWGVPPHMLHPQGQRPQQPPLPQSLFGVHAAIASRLVHLCRLHRLPVLATKTAAVTERSPADAGEWPGVGGEGGMPVQLQQREFMPIPWQNIVTHRLLLHSCGVVSGPASRGSVAPPVHPTQVLTTIAAEMLGPVGHAGGGTSTGHVHSSGGASPHGAHVGAGSGGKGVCQLVVSAVAMVEW